MGSSSTRWSAHIASLLAIVSSCGPAQAQTSGSQWEFRALAYAYIPELHGSASIPTGATPDIKIDPNQIISNLNFAFMGAFEARKGAWGVFTDVVYSDVGGSKTATRSLSIGGGTLPATVTADVHLNVKSTMWTLGGTYRIVDRPDVTLDLMLGARGLFLEQKLNWQFSADVGPSGPARQGSGDTSPTNWDGILGAKGRWIFGQRSAWFVPYYLDIGAGDSELTWQGMTGIGYAFSWGEVIGVWRYIDYQSSHDASLTLNGPALGVALHW